MRSHIYRPVGPSTPFPSRCVNCFAILLKSLKSKILKICAPPLYRGVRGLRKYHDQTPRREQLLIATAVALGVSVSVGGALTIQSYSRAAAHNEFAAPATQFTTLLSRALDQHLNVVRTLSDLLRDAEAIDRWRFHELAAENLADNPGVTAIQWIPAVAASDRKAFEARASDDGLFDFRFTERRADDRVTTARKRPSYFPIYFVEPFEGNEELLGLDLLSEPSTAALLVQARDGGMMVTDRLAADPEQTGAEPAIYVVQPVYRGESVPFTVTDRREALLGFLRVRFRLRELISAALPGVMVPPGLDIYLFEPTAASAERLVYNYPSPEGRWSSASLSLEEAIEGLSISAPYLFVDRRWSIVVRPQPSHFLRSIDSASWGFLAVTLLLTALSVQYVISAQIRTRAIEDSVRERTAALQLEITVRKQVEQQLRAAKDQAEVASRAKAEFLAMMSHELRTPLNAVIGFADVMLEQVFGPMDNDKYRGYAQDIRASGLHLLSLINDILDLSKIEAKQFELNEEAFEFAEVWLMVRSLLKDKAAAAGLNFDDRIFEDLPSLYADQRVFRQILINLLSNAIKFTPNGGSITVCAEISAGGGFVFSVSDTGIGISEENLETVLQPFRQVDGSLSRKYEGTGLGLPLTQQLVEMHGGQLEIESRLGWGTDVRVILPPERVIPQPTRAKMVARKVAAV